jgi:hypothetical protein
MAPGRFAVAVTQIGAIPMGLLGRVFGAGNPKPTEDLTVAILDKYLDKDFRVFPMAKSRQSLGQVEAVSRKFGVTFPPEFIAHVCGRFPGIYVEVIEKVWPRPKLHDVGPFWSFLYALHTFTSAPESEPWMRLDFAAKEFAKTGLGAVPVLQIVSDADLYCVDSEGQIVQFKHETNELEPVQLDFWQLFEREVSELRKRKDRKKTKA